MDLALYCPVYGYYEKEMDTLGRRGDYYTSVSVGSLFGELLAFQFSDWLGSAPPLPPLPLPLPPRPLPPRPRNRNREVSGTDYEDEKPRQPDREHGPLQIV